MTATFLAIITFAALAYLAGLVIEDVIAGIRYEAECRERDAAHPDHAERT